jgi:uncharacterized membrane protein YhaH (DUF805 family)
MTKKDLEEVWRDKPDDVVITAAIGVSEYTAEGQEVIRAELLRRNIPLPTPLGLGVSASEGFSPRLRFLPTNFVACLRRFKTFSGRASRREYWGFVLVVIAVHLGIRLAPWPADAVVDDVLLVWWDLVVLVPGIAVGVRRLHDVSSTGLWLLLGPIPVANFIPLAMLATKSHGRNAYGPPPDSPAAPAPATQ